MMDFVPDRELPILLEVGKRIIPNDADDRWPDADLKAHPLARRESRNGETVSHSEIDWD